MLSIPLTWPVGQGVKTSPSHGENTSSILVLAARNFRSDSEVFCCSAIWARCSRKQKKPQTYLCILHICLWLLLLFLLFTLILFYRFFTRIVYCHSSGGCPLFLYRYHALLGNIACFHGDRCLSSFLSGYLTFGAYGYDALVGAGVFDGCFCSGWGKFWFDGKGFALL